MPHSNEMPVKCLECAKSAPSVIHAECKFCQQLEFREEILCHLNRCIQNPADFQCHAFRPILKLVSASGARVADSDEVSKGPVHREFSPSLLQSERIKYKRALVLQKSKRDPDEVYIELKYHFAWNVIHRRPAFAASRNILDFIHDTFFRCGDLIGGSVNLLWLAPDHIHLYVESDGELSVETVAQEIKRFSQDAILGGLKDIEDRLAAGVGIWDVAYFTETVG